MRIIKLSLFLLVISPQLAWGQSGLKRTSAKELKPRMVVLTDVSTWETDDSESLVRLLVYADLLEIEGLVFTTGRSLGHTRDDFFDLIHDAVNAYEKDLPNLLKRSGQTEFLKDESQQEIAYWPSPEYLKQRTVYGSKNRGYKFLGENNDSPGSDLIIKLADEDDDRPIWITVWGGGNTLAQAIWRIQQERSPEEIKIADKTADKIKIKIPTGSAGKNFHVICEVTDHGEPNLTSYRRIVVGSKE